MKYQLLTDCDLGSILRVSRSTIWRWAYQGILPKPLKIGGASRWKIEDVEVFLDKHSNPIFKDNLD